MSFYVNDIERAQIEQAAAAHGVGLSEFFRRRSLGQKMPVAAERQQQAETTTALLRLGVNLNQMAKHMNAGRSPAHDAIMELVGRINREMDKLDESYRDRPRP